MGQKQQEACPEKWLHEASFNEVCNVPEAIFVKLFNEWSPPTQARDVTLLASSVLASSCKNRGWSCKNRAEAARFLTVYCKNQG